MVSMPLVLQADQVQAKNHNEAIAHIHDFLLQEIFAFILSLGLISSKFGCSNAYGAANIFNVLDYGAVGNSITDDSQVIPFFFPSIPEKSLFPCFSLRFG